MSGIGKWNLSVGAVLVGAAVVCSVLDLISAAVVIGILGMLGVSVAGYDALYNWAERTELRRRGAKAGPDGESR
ncbi:hypothetical protein [Amycolatopsis albispora]|uniref:Uncharacterized protein n=1 Tax=Amycolatopsis albispora TaxID=1804986 RepID=A0A344L2Z9_9PSEU|nr:hypothetical protein [Amycolatopsis albispora]AXB42423.1 hypothetical protein A4R43_07690 [Amycolatopsis albispora]